jgi:hypothetical protein
MYEGRLGVPLEFFLDHCHRHGNNKAWTPSTAYNFGSPSENRICTRCANPQDIQGLFRSILG